MPFKRLRSERVRTRTTLPVFAVAALLAFGAAGASADTTVATVAGESLTPAASGTAVLTDSNAVGGKALALYSGTVATGTVKLSAATTSIGVVARGTQCSGAPTLKLTVDGSSVAAWNVTTTGYWTYSVAKALAAGTHTISVALTNDYSTSSCDRNLVVDDLRFIAGTTTSNAAATTPVSAKLRWAAPTLTSPTTVTVAQGDQGLMLDKAKDYIVDLGTTVHQGNLVINGGRNVRIVGGTIKLPATSTKNTALSILNSTGTVHVEGVLFDGTAREMDAIQVAAPAATVQVENVRVVGLHGTFATNHSDVIQTYGGVAKLRVDHLTADSNYQGIFTRPDQGAIGSVELQNVDLTFNNALATSSGGYLLWMTTDCTMAPTTLTNVYITPRSGTNVGTAVWPATNDATCPSKLTGNTVTFPKLPVTGGVIGGAPSTGSFVPATLAGVAYKSPGYQ
jgi:hypothetical protein